MITLQDKEQLAQKRHFRSTNCRSAGLFQDWVSVFELSAAASVEKGIVKPDAEEENAFLAAWEDYANADKTIVKFVPASGAASRMFKDLFEFWGCVQRTDYCLWTYLFENLTSFAFYADLSAACEKQTGKTAAQLVQEGNYKAVVAALLTAEGLNYGSPPKGCSSFICMKTGTYAARRAFGGRALYAAGKVAVPMCTSPFRRSTDSSSKRWWTRRRKAYADKYGVTYNVSFLNRNKAQTPLRPTWITSRFATRASFCSVRAVTVRWLRTQWPRCGCGVY